MPISTREYSNLIARCILATAESGRNTVDTLIAIYQEHGIPFDVYVQDRRIVVNVIDKETGEACRSIIHNKKVLEHYKRSGIEWKKKQSKNSFDK